MIIYKVTKVLIVIFHPVDNGGIISIRKSFTFCAAVVVPLGVFNLSNVKRSKTRNLDSYRV